MWPNVLNSFLYIMFISKLYAVELIRNIFLKLKRSLIYGIFICKF